MSEAMLRLSGISKHFARPLDAAQRIINLFGGQHQPQVVQALDGIDLDIAAGEVVGLVGESGCGKSTLGRIVAGIYPPSDGAVHWQGVMPLQVQMIFQDPMSSLNPRKRVLDIVGEAPRVHGLTGRSELAGYVDEVLSRVGLDPSYKRRYPHQFSGGQRARIGIARALAVNPRFLVCDESVAALDVSIQAQVLNLFMRLRAELNLTYLFISHDLSVVRHISDKVLIMYLGRIVESAPTDAFYAAPAHPYARALIANVPRIDARHRAFSLIKGEIPSPLAPPSGCHFHPRCPQAGRRCAAERPSLRDIGTGRRVACHLEDGGVN